MTIIVLKNGKRYAIDPVAEPDYTDKYLQEDGNPFPKEIIAIVVPPDMIEPESIMSPLVGEEEEPEDEEEEESPEELEITPQKPARRARRKSK